MAEWRAQILKDVDKVVFLGATCGVIIVFGENSHPLVANKGGQVLCAAGELGQGRIIVFSHNRFVKAFHKHQDGNKRLNDNIKKWLRRDDVDEKVVDLHSKLKFDDLPPGCNILTWGSHHFPNVSFLNAMTKWIEEGGSLICGVCPWGFEDAHKIQVHDIPINHILGKIGMAYAGRDTYKSSNGETLMVENAAEYAKLDMVLEATKRYPHEMGRARHFVRHLPTTVYEMHKQTFVEVMQLLATGTNSVPTRANPVSCHQGKRAAEILSNILIRDGHDGKSTVAPGIEEFPGVFYSTPELATASLKIPGTGGFKYHPTGCYLQAGTVLEVIWKKTAKPWTVVIGSHQDKLYDVEKHWRRWPIVTMKRLMSESPLKICNPFGGLVYLQSPRGDPGDIEVTLHNIVPAPLFTYETSQQWDSYERHKQGLWCDIIGQHISFTVPTTTVRNLTDLTSTMEVWDSVVAAHIDLRGCDPSEGRGQWVVADEQPSAGYMHAGYPICTHLDVTDPSKFHDGKFLLNGELVQRKGSWGLFHELGHNFQDKLWTWAGTGEVTVNIFTLHAMDVLCDIKPWSHPKVKKKMKRAKEYLTNGAAIAQWRNNPWIALFVYAQLARDFGWDAYKAVFRIYNELPKEERPDTREEKERQWIVRFSGVVKRNLCPLFEFWGWSIPPNIVETLASFAPYLPKDETTTELAPERALAISKKYNCELTAPGDDSKILQTRTDL